MEGNGCDHCEAVEIGETEGFNEANEFIQYEICLCPECGEDFLFPLAA